jgi:hypothetical protein
MDRTPPATAAKPRHVTPASSTASVRGLAYTLFRHGHGLSHEESLRRMRASLPMGPDWPPKAA